MAAGGAGGGDFPGPPNKVVVHLKAAARSDGYACPAPSHRLIEVPVRTRSRTNVTPGLPSLDLHSRFSIHDKKSISTMERSITFNLSSARETPRYSFQFCRLGPLGSGGPSRRRIPAFPRNLPLEECRIAPTPTRRERTEQPEWGKFPACSVCRPGRTDADGRVSQRARSVGWGATN